jgi:hypothetical protein
MEESRSPKAMPDGKALHMIMGEANKYIFAHVLNFLSTQVSPLFLKTS